MLEDEEKKGFDDLVKTITLKNKPSFENYFDGLEKKNAKKNQKKKGKEEIEDGEFEEIQKKLEKNKKENVKKIKK